jgi:hypothetical protein
MDCIDKKIVVNYRSQVTTKIHQSGLRNNYMHVMDKGKQQEEQTRNIQLRTYWHTSERNCYSIRWQECCITSTLVEEENI